MNNFPCQSDYGLDEWERLENSAEAEAEHKEAIADKAMDQDADWALLEEKLLESDHIEAILDTLRDHSKGGNRDLTTYYDMAVKLLGIFDDAVVDTIDQNYDELCVSIKA